MLILLSPAKALNFEPASAETAITVPRFLGRALELRTAARSLSASQWQVLSGISPELAGLNRARFAAMQLQPEAPGTKQAVLAFSGDVYRGLDAASLTATSLEWAQDHVRILSGLYGLLRPLDGIEPYRLEMGTRLKTAGANTLYDFWGDTLALSLAREAKGLPIVNLASNEYVKALRTREGAPEMINCAFHEVKDGRARPLFMFTKRARGLMCRFMIEHRIDRPKSLRDFECEGYRFDARTSSPTRYVFVRAQPAPLQPVRKRPLAAIDH